MRSVLFALLLVVVAKARITPIVITLFSWATRRRPGPRKEQLMTPTLRPVGAVTSSKPFHIQFNSLPDTDLGILHQILRNAQRATRMRQNLKDVEEPN